MKGRNMRDKDQMRYGRDGRSVKIQPVLPSKIARGIITFGITIKSRCQDQSYEF